MAGRRLLRKKLTYRCAGEVSLAQHAQHWQGFTWQSGPTIVALVLPDGGTLQVWAISEAEGRRVIEHALVIAGRPAGGGQGAEWIVTTATGGRNGRTATMQTHESADGIGVSSRAGPSGPPELWRPPPAAGQAP